MVFKFGEEGFGDYNDTLGEIAISQHFLVPFGWLAGYLEVIAVDQYAKTRGEAMPVMDALQFDSTVSSQWARKSRPCGTDQPWAIAPMRNLHLGQYTLVPQREP